MQAFYRLFLRIGHFIRQKAGIVTALVFAAALFFPAAAAGNPDTWAETKMEETGKEENTTELGTAAQEHTAWEHTDGEQEACLLIGRLMEEHGKKRQMTEELVKIQAEEAKQELSKWQQAESGQAGLEQAESERTFTAFSLAAGGKRTGLSEEDYRILLKIVEAEAGICDEKGRLLVANVILNRVKSSQFPDSVRSVVYQPSQFSPVGSGLIDRVFVTEKTRKSVDRALAGEDDSQGALYFMNRGKSQKKAVRWFDTHLTYLFEHGGHEFFK